YNALLPGQTMFSNDGPLGELMAQCHRLPARFFGCWQDLNSVGFDGGAASPTISFGLQMLLGPIWFSKLYAMLSLLILGLSAWCFFRVSKLSAPACVLGGLAAMLNSTYFSVACWGVGAHDITAGMIFLALAALADTSAPRRWLRVVLAGMAVGMAVSEGADVGAIYSLYVAAFVVYQMWTTGGSPVKSVAFGLGRLTLVVLCAGFLAAQSIHGLVDTSIIGVKGAQQDAKTKAERWDWATQWSMPRLETLNVVIPGIFGYRMDDLNERAYWGTMGRAPAVAKYIENGRQGTRPKGFIRYSGGGNYAGGLVVLLGLWAAAESWRRRNSVFNPLERKWVWFWLAVAVVSMLLALGRFAPFYKFVYAIPYFSTIRNPTKFLYPFSFGLVTLFAFGVHGLYRRYMQRVSPVPPSNGGNASGWWRRLSSFERGWVYGCALVGVGILIGWWQYAASRSALVQFLQGDEIGVSPEAVADFSIAHAGWLVVVFFLGAGLMVLMFSQAFSGRGAALGIGCLGVLLVGDLGLADAPWVHYWNYAEKYATNPILEILEDKPYEHRVCVAPLDQSREFAPCFKLYKLEWLQHEFPYNNVESFETVEMSRMPLDYAAWAGAINNTNRPGTWFHLTRAWELTSVGYVVAPLGLGDYLNRQGFFDQPPFRLVTRFKLARKPGIEQATRPDEVTAVPAEDGPFALFQFTLALPRATLFSKWQVNTNGTNVLAQVMAPSFNPRESVFVDDIMPANPAAATNAPAGSVTIVNYAPKDIVLSADVKAPSILMLSDHYQPDWKVWVDGRPDTMLRCDFLMRGVQLAPGTHRVEFKFKPPTGWLDVSATALVTTVAALGLLVTSTWKERVAAAAPLAPAPKVATPTKAETGKPGRRPDSRKKQGESRVAKR
ncbi:MAG TPA: hypothetical protein VL970_15940, partial [Candidatus Acidoferrales bacterium]|nr:hypothetical protein [Candidatus Acidoferrales bacterium]